MLVHPADLERCPRLAWAGASRHGFSGEEDYAMGDVWCLHVYDWRGHLTIDGHRFAIRPGTLSLTPPWARLHYEFEGSGCRHYSLQFVLAADPAAPWALPAITTGEGARNADRRLRPCVDWYHDDRRRAEVRLWDELASLAVPAGNPPAPGDDLVARARAWIEEHLDEGVNVAEVARANGVTSTHLSRVFKRATGATCSQWLRRRRVQRAQHLLLHGRRPVREIAELVGIPDLQHFNKVIRAELGASPRAVRAGVSTRRVR